MATMNVSLPDLMKEWVEEQIKTGHYSNASDIEAILPRSVLDFRVERTENYFQFLTHCLELLADIPRWAALWTTYDRATAVFSTKAM